MGFPPESWERAKDVVSEEQGRQEGVGETGREDRRGGQAWGEKCTQGGRKDGLAPHSPADKPSPSRLHGLSAQDGVQVLGGAVSLSGSREPPTRALSGPTVSEVGKGPLQRALQVPVPHFLERSGEELQPTR